VTVETLGQLFLHSVAYNKPDHLLVKQDADFAPVSSEELYRRVARLHLALSEWGLEKGDRCALLAENRWEWAVADFAMVTAGVVSVPLYPTLPADQIHYILENSGARAIFVSTTAQQEKIESIRSRLPAVERVIRFDGQPLIPEGPLSDSERRQFQAALDAVRPDDLATIVYTSGTTGTPKGVMLTHANLVSNILGAEPDLYPSDVALSFLPLAHIYQRMVDYTHYYCGVTVAHIEAIDRVAEFLGQVRPTLIVAVPRFYEKLYARLMEAVNAASPLRQRLFHWALAVGFQSTPYRLANRPLPPLLRWRFALADRLIYSKLRRRMGGRIRRLTSGGAPLARELAEFFYAVRLPILEGYGLTEASPVISANRLDCLRFGTVGKPLRNVEVRLAADGEILARGPNIMRGYYKMERETAEALRDGWFHTGDIGLFDEDGFLIILDRKKDLLKTSGGKYIAPQAIENKLKNNPFIADAVVIADRRRFPSALIVPNFDRLEAFARERGISCASRMELVQNPEIVRRMEEEVAGVCVDLAPFEQIKKVAILDREFSIAEGEITPTLKVRRREVESRYREAIEQIYQGSY
jgi:long-chain acyl-CoA synthetase